MNKIYKYDLELTFNPQRVSVSMPRKVLAAQYVPARDTISVWVNVDPEASDMDLEFIIVPTGSGNDDVLALSSNWEYLGTVQMNNGTLIWHIFWRVAE